MSNRWLLPLLLRHRVSGRKVVSLRSSSPKTKVSLRAKIYIGSDFKHQPSADVRTEAQPKLYLYLYRYLRPAPYLPYLRSAPAPTPTPTSRLYLP